jgi:hypothetical protein
MLRLFLLGCGLVFAGAMVEIIVLILKWVGYCLLAFVVSGTLVRLGFGQWPIWVIEPLAKVRSWLPWA